MEKSSNTSKAQSLRKRANGKPSICSSELESRVEAIRIQLEEERKRRMDVENQIRDFVYQRGGPQAAAVAKILKESDLAESNSRSANSRGSVRSLDSSSQRSNKNSNNTASSYGRQVVLPPITNDENSNNINSNNNSAPNSNQNNNNSIPKPPQRKTSVPVVVDGDIIAKCEQEASDCDKLLRQLNQSHAVVLSRKPLLPQAARGISRKSGPNGQQSHVAQTGAAGCDYVMARRSKATPAQLYMMNQWHQERMDKINAFTFGIAGGSGY